MATISDSPARALTGNQPCVHIVPEAHLLLWADRRKKMRLVCSRKKTTAAQSMPPIYRRLLTEIWLPARVLSKHGPISGKEDSFEKPTRGSSERLAASLKVVSVRAFWVFNSIGRRFVFWRRGPHAALLSPRQAGRRIRGCCLRSNVYLWV